MSESSNNNSNEPINNNTNEPINNNTNEPINNNTNEPINNNTNEPINNNTNEPINNNINENLVINNVVDSFLHNIVSQISSRMSLSLPTPLSQIDYTMQRPSRLFGNNITNIMAQSIMEENPYKIIISEKGLDLLKTISFDGTQLNKQCPITLDEFKQSELITELPCKHVFNTGAITKWLKEESNLCPLCRKGLPFIEQRKVPLLNNATTMNYIEIVNEPIIQEPSEETTTLTDSTSSIETTISTATVSSIETTTPIIEIIENMDNINEDEEIEEEEIEEEEIEEEEIENISTPIHNFPQLLQSFIYRQMQCDEEEMVQFAIMESLNDLSRTNASSDNSLNNNYMSDDDYMTDDEDSN